MDITQYTNDLADRANAAARQLMTTSGSARAAALQIVADRLLERTDEIKAANAKDLAAGKDSGLSTAMLERLTLSDSRIEAMADSLRQIAEQVDPVGQIISGEVRPNGLRLQKIRVPIGVIFFIFESRPNVTTDAAGLCLKSGNAVILRGGKEAIHSNTVTSNIIAEGFAQAGINRDAVQLVNTPDRSVVSELLKMQGRIDLVIPRGGEGLIRAVTEQSRIPVIKHYTGNCHVYVDSNCDPDMAHDICINAKVQRPSVCNATETILLHKDVVASGLFKRICQSLTKEGVEIRGDKQAIAAADNIKPATDDDWATEYNDLIVAVKIVDNLDDAVAHINKFGSKHTDAIVTNVVQTADRFVETVDSANVFVNCSTRFSDGGEYGLGAEIGISTDKLHARGPMGAADMTTYKWVAYGNGQVRG